MPRPDNFKTKPRGDSSNESISLVPLFNPSLKDQTMSRLLIQLSHISKSFGPSILFNDISLSINAGESFALIGENGSGKTTLLHLLIESILPEAGQVRRSADLSIGFLPQEVTIAHPELSIKQYLEKGALTDLEQRMTTCLDNPNRLMEWAQLHDEYEKRGGYRRVPLEKALKGLKLKADLEKPMASLSGGQRVRVALAKALINNPGLLLLDEPTNHLDQEMLIWLQEMLHHRTGATIIVSHDRKFLNESCNRLIELHQGQLSYFGGSYDFYLQEKENFIEKQIKAYEEQEEEKVYIKQKICAITSSKGKAVPPTDRNRMAYDKQGEKHQKSVQRTLNELKERLQEIEAHPLSHPKPKSVTGLRFISTPLTSKVAIEFRDVTKSFSGKIIFSKLSWSLCKGDRIILMGPNGSGKTTLLRCAYGEEPIDSGTITRAPSAKIAYLDQEVEMLPMHQTPLEYFESRFSLPEENLRKELHKMALGDAKLLHRPFGSMSVGQRKRLMLLLLILEKPNVLLLDEPTNHLDLLTLEAFEKALLNFDGAMLAISHDQTFINKIATKVW
jgi:ATPase subunit of ABC transporter with duplicated ATPase domains